MLVIMSGKHINKEGKSSEAANLFSLAQNLHNHVYPIPEDAVRAYARYMRKCDLAESKKAYEGNTAKPKEKYYKDYQLYSDLRDTAEALASNASHARNLLNGSSVVIESLSAAKKLYSKSISLEKTPETYLHLAVCCAQLGQFNEALDNCKNAIEMNREFPEAQLLMDMLDGFVNPLMVESGDDKKNKTKWQNWFDLTIADKFDHAVDPASFRYPTIAQ